MKIGVKVFFGVKRWGIVYFFDSIDILKKTMENDEIELQNVIWGGLWMFFQGAFPYLRKPRFCNKLIILNSSINII